MLKQKDQGKIEEEVQFIKYREENESIRVRPCDIVMECFEGNGNKEEGRNGRKGRKGKKGRVGGARSNRRLKAPQLVAYWINTHKLTSPRTNFTHRNLFHFVYIIFICLN